MKTRKAFTLIELLISLSIFSLLLALIYYSFSVELRFFNKNVSEFEKTQIINMLMTRISRDIHSARGFAALSSDNLLSLAVGSNSIEYTFIYDKVKRKEGGYSTYLTMPGDINSLQFAYPKNKLILITIDGNSTGAAMRN